MLIAAAVHELSQEDARNPSHVYARILRKAIQKHLVLDDLHLGDVLIALRNSRYSIDRKSGLFASTKDRNYALTALANRCLSCDLLVDICHNYNRQRTSFFRNHRPVLPVTSADVIPARLDPDFRKLHDFRAPGYLRSVHRAYASL